MGQPPACNKQRRTLSSYSAAVALRCALLGVLLAISLPVAGNESDVRIVIDVSGSMKQNDPDNLRVPALKMLSALLPQDTQAGVWTFGQYVNMLVKHGPANGAWKRQANISADSIGSVALRTNVGEALERVTWDLDSDSRRDRHILLLTDGKVDISDDPATNTAEARRIISALLPRLVDQGVRLHTLALSAQADVNFLKQLSIATGGYHAALTNPEELSSYFLKTLSAAAPPNEVSLGEDASFTIDESVRQFTALLYRNPGQATALIAPDGARQTQANPGADVRWYQDTEFDIVTVSNPQAGRWLAETGADGRVSVVSDLSLAVGDIPAAIYPGYEGRIGVQLRDQGRAINDEALLSVLQLEATYQRSDAPPTPIAVEAPMSADGSYQLLLGPLSKPGDYAINVRAIAPTFTRQRSLISSLRDPVSVSVERLDNNTAAVVVTFADANIDFSTLQLIGQVTQEGQSTQLLPLGDSEAGQWRLELATDGAQKVLDVVIDIKGNYLNGQLFSLSTTAVSVALPDSQNQSLAVALDGAVLRQEGVAVEEPPAVDPVTPATIEPVSDQPGSEEMMPEPVESIPWLTIALITLGTALVAGIAAAGVLLVRRRKNTAEGDEASESGEAASTDGEQEAVEEDFDSLLVELDDACNEVGEAAEAARQRAEEAQAKETAAQEKAEEVIAQKAETTAEPSAPAPAAETEAAAEAEAETEATESDQAPAVADDKTDTEADQPTANAVSDNDDAVADTDDAVAESEIDEASEPQAPAPDNESAHEEATAPTEAPPNEALDEEGTQEASEPTLESPEPTVASDATAEPINDSSNEPADEPAREARS